MSFGVMGETGKSDDDAEGPWGEAREQMKQSGTQIGWAADVGEGYCLVARHLIWYSVLHTVQLNAASF